MKEIESLLIVLSIFFTMLVILCIIMLLNNYNAVFTIPFFIKNSAKVLLLLLWIVSSGYIWIKNDKYGL